ncbi:MAG TPA: hypothetical protein VHU84_10505 [Lacipirellulaceae bacterium]|nr:hypothetical protein [Lacipirellulaceae bacterium]
MTVVAVAIAILSQYPIAAVLLVGVTSTLAFLTLSVFFAVLAAHGFLRFWHSYDATDAGENTPPTDVG